MAILGIDANTCNPDYSINDFTFWRRNFKKYMETEEGVARFNNLYPIADAKILYSVFGTDWKLAMSLCIAHYTYLIATNHQSPSGDTLESVLGGGATKGVVTSASIGGFSKSISSELTMMSEDEAKFWNQSSYGQQLMALYKTKAVPSIFVVTSNSSILPPYLGSQDSCCCCKKKEEDDTHNVWKGKH